MVKEILSNSFNINVNKGEAIPPSYITKEILSNTFNININKMSNRPPVITNLDFSLSGRDCVINFDIHDEDNDKMNVYLIKNNQEELILDNQLSGSKTITLYNLPTGTTTISLRVSDGFLDCRSETINIEVQEVVQNRPPVITNLKHSLSGKNCTITFNIHDEDNDKMNVYLTRNSKEEMVLNNQSSGNKTVTVNNLPVGTHIMSLRVNDGKLNTYSDTFRVTVEEEIVNNPPTISNIQVNKTNSVGVYELEFKIQDADNDKMDVYLKVGNSNYEPILVNQSNGVKQYKGQGLSAGNHTCFIKVSDGKQEVISNSFNIRIPQTSNDNIFESIELITSTTIKANTPTRVAIKLKSKANIDKKTIHPKIKNIGNKVKIYNAQWEKGNVLTDWRESVSEISDKTSSLKVGLDNITSKVETIQDDYVTSSEIKQLDESWTATFKDGYKEGIVRLDKDGIKVSSTTANTYTNINAEGFSLSNGNNEKLLDMNKKGLFITGNIEGSNITGSTFSSKSGYFKVLDDGTAEAVSLSIEDEISTDTLNVKHISNSKYQSVLDRSYNVHINVNYTAEEEAKELIHGGHYRSFDNLIDVCPRNLNGYTLTINLWSEITESVNFNMFNSGIITINLNGNTVRGHMIFQGHSMRYRIYGKDVDNTGTGTFGSIMPNTGHSATGGNYSIQVSYSHLMAYDLKIYGGKSSGNNNGISVTNLSKAYLNNLQFVGCYSAVRSYSASDAYVASSNGLTSSHSFYASSGSRINLNGTTQAGRNGSTSHTGTSGNGQIYASGVTFAGSSVSGSNDTPAPSKVTKTATITANYGDTYRKTVYNSWKKDGTVRQGEWSNYGDCIGAWFFGTKIEDYSNKEITKVEVTVKRQAGGSNGEVVHTLKMHNQASRPSGSLSFRSDFSKDFKVAVNNSFKVTLSTSDEIAAFKKCKGFGLEPKSYNQTYYSVCSGSLSVKITYKE